MTTAILRLYPQRIIYTLISHGQLLVCKAMDNGADILDKLYAEIQPHKIDQLNLIVRGQLLKTIDDSSVLLRDLEEKGKVVCSQEDVERILHICKMSGVEKVKLFSNLDFYEHVAGEPKILVDEYFGGDVLFCILNEGGVVDYVVSKPQLAEQTLVSLFTTYGNLKVINASDGVSSFNWDITNLDKLSEDTRECVGDSLFTLSCGKGFEFKSKESAGSSAHIPLAAELSEELEEELGEDLSESLETTVAPEVSAARSKKTKPSTREIKPRFATNLNWKDKLGETSASSLFEEENNGDYEDDVPTPIWMTILNRVFLTLLTLGVLVIAAAQIVPRLGSDPVPQNSNYPVYLSEVTKYLEAYVASMEKNQPLVSTAYLSISEIPEGSTIEVVDYLHRSVYVTINLLSEENKIAYQQHLSTKFQLISSEVIGQNESGMKVRFRLDLL
jgi:hypothetical protein